MHVDVTTAPPHDLDQDEEIDGRVAIHDSDHVEVKLECHLAAGARSRYRVETYFFVPRSLGLNAANYPRDQFYNDVQTYIRFKTPSIPLATLADRHAPESPLALIRGLLDRAHQRPRDRALRAELRYELRMFGCVARARMRNRVAAILDHIGALAGAEDQYQVLVDDIVAMAARLADDITTLLREWRELRASFVDGTASDSSRDMYLHVDEYLSLAAEEKLTAVVRAIDDSDSLNGQMSNIRGRLCELLVEERNYRASAGYVTATRVNGAGERYVYRRGVLKKLVASVLWLEVDKQHERRALGDVAAAIAAGIAMLIAVLATLYASQRWMTNTAAFVAAAVVTYMLKDRIKDWLKGYFSRRIHRVLPDYNIAIRDPMTDEYLGSSRETVGFVPADRVPEEVRRLRHQQAQSPIETEAKQEVVLRYDKEIRLRNTQVVERMHLTDYALNDITRFALWQLMARADDPKHAMAIYSPELDRIENVRFRRVYHLNIVMVLCAGAGASETRSMRHLRVIFDKHKIRRLEQITA